MTVLDPVSKLRLELLKGKNDIANGKFFRA